MKQWHTAAILLAVALCVYGCHDATTNISGAQGNKPKGTEAPKSRDEIKLTATQQQEGGVRTVIAALKPVAAGATANGTIVPNENRTWHVGAYVLGQVTRVIAAVGDMVQPSEVIARMHSHEIHDTRAAYKQAQASLEEAKAQLDLSERARDRAQRLFTLQAISRGQLEQANSDLTKAMAMTATAQASIERERVHLSEVLGVRMEEDGSEESDTIPVRSPAAGVVLERSVSVGSVVSPGMPIYVIADLSNLWMIAAVNETDIGHVHPGQTVELRVRSYPDRVFSGTVLKLGETLDPSTRTLQVRILVPNRGGALKPQMFASVTFTGTAQAKVIELPGSAIQDVNGQRVVFLQTGAETFRPSVVRTGEMQNGRVRILEGVKAGDRVVVDGSYSLKTELMKSSLSEEE